LEAEFEDEDIEKALGIEEVEEDEEIEEEIEEKTEEDEEDEEEEEDDLEADDDGELEEEVEHDEVVVEASDDWLVSQKEKIKNKVGDSVITLEQILKGIVKKKT
jgi:hypothetical protein